MGIFDSSSEQTSRLELPGYMQGLAPQMTSMMSGLLGQDYLSPDQLVAQFSPWQQAAMSSQFDAGGNQAMMANALYGPAMQGLAGFGVGQQALGGILGQGAMQNQGVNMDYVGGLIDNDVLQSQIDAATRDPYRQLTEQQLPAAGLAAAASGNTGSTRRGVGEAILQRGYEDRAADIGGQMRGQAYSQALGLGGQQASQNAMLGAQFQGLGANIGQQLMQGGAMGANLMGAGQGMQNLGINQQMLAGGMQTGRDQALLDAGLQGFMFPYQQLQMLNPLANQNAQTYGTQVQESSSDPGWGNTVLGAGLGLAGTAMMGGWNPMAGMGGGGSGFDPSGFVPYRVPYGT